MTKPFSKPQDYHPRIARMLVSTMREHKCGMAKACTLSTDLPSYETARRWLFEEPDFRAIYPNKRQTWFAGMSEAQIAAKRMPGYKP